MAILTVVLGVVFVLLMLSLLATTIMELVASFMKLRGRNLKKALSNMLVGLKKDSDEQDDSMFNKFTENALYRQLCHRYGSSTSEPPSYVSSDAFQSILFDVLLDGDDLEETTIKQKIDELENDDLKRVLTQLMRDADGKLDGFKDNINVWYNNVMDRSSGWYKRTTQKIIMIVGLVIAVTLNADTLAIYERLETNPEVLEKIVELAENHVDKETNTIKIPQGEITFMESKENLQQFIDNEIAAIKSPLGLGWKNIDMENASIYDWMVKALGWLVTALAISLGAPFWFDILRKLVSIRSSGTKPS